MKCPACSEEDVRIARGKSFLEERVYPLLFLRPFRCRICRARFYRFRLQNGNRGPKRIKRRKRPWEKEEDDGWQTTSKNQPDNEEFQRLIQEIAEAERKLFGSSPRED